MSSSFTFAIVAKSDNPIYELVVSPKKEEPTVNQQNQFFLHAVCSPLCQPACAQARGYCAANPASRFPRVRRPPAALAGAGHCRRGAVENQQHVSQGMSNALITSVVFSVLCNAAASSRLCRAILVHS